MIFRNMLLTKVCNGIPSFVYISEEESKWLYEVLDGVEYYEIQNMLYYLLRSEEILKGIFPKISLEVLYINLYNLFKVRDVEKIIHDLEKEEHPPVEHKKSVPGSFNITNFIEFLKTRKPFVSSIFENIDIQMENDSVILCLDKKYSFIKADTKLKEEIKQYLKEFFGKEIDLVFKDSEENSKKNVIEEYISEANRLFNP